MKRVFIDTEFNGFGGELISYALVPEDENFPTFYKVLPYVIDEYDPWVEKNVIPVLNEYNESSEKLDEYLNNNFRGEEVVFMADWPDDIKYLSAELITGPGIMINNDFDITFVIDRNLDEGPYSPMYPHNALSDAAANRENYRYRYSDEEE